jgi:cytochrome c5
MNKLVLFFVFIIFMATSCQNKNEETLYPNLNCDTTDVKFSTTITQFINENCNNCHSGSLAYGNPQVRLDSYAGIKTVVDNGRFYNALTGVTKQMPPSGKLPDCSIRKVKAWIDSGSSNN